MKQFVVTSLMIALPLVACGGDDGHEHVTLPDASSNSGSGSGSGSGSAAACKGQSTYAVTLGSADQFVFGDDPANGAEVFWQGTLGGTNPFDLLTIELWTGGNSADFPNGAATGTFDFSQNNDSQYLTCGACAYIMPQAPIGSDGHIDDSYDANNESYEAESGTMMITSVGSGSGSGRTGSFSGTLHNVVFKHHNLVGSGSDTMEIEATDGCQTTIADLAFDATFDTSTARTQKSTNSRTVRLKLKNRHF